MRDATYTLSDDKQFVRFCFPRSEAEFDFVELTLTRADVLRLARMVRKGASSVVLRDYDGRVAVMPDTHGERYLCISRRHATKWTGVAAYPYWKFGELLGAVLNDLETDS